MQQQSIDAVHMFHGQMFHFVKDDGHVQYFILTSFPLWWDICNILFNDQHLVIVCTCG